MAGLTRVRHQLFSERFVEAVRPTPEAGMIAEIQVWFPVGEPVLDVDTGGYTTVKTIVYTGSARAQPLRSPRQALVPGNDTLVQSYQFQIPIDPGKTLDLRPNMRVTVTASPLNPTILDYEYVVQDIGDSSNPVERTFVCAVDNEIKE